MALRYDSGRLGRVERTPQGGIRADAAICRAGVLRYPWGNELRPPEELDSPTMRAGIRGMPVTIGHPRGGRVTTANIGAVQVGHVGESLRVEDEHALVPTYVQRQDAITRLDSGDLDGTVSLGYDVGRLEQTPGVWRDGTPYQAIQRDIKPHHLALVRPGERPRAGDTVALRLDAHGDAVLEDEEREDSNPTGGRPGEEVSVKTTIKVKGMPFVIEGDSPEALQVAIDQAIAEAGAKAADLQTRLDSVTAQLETVTGERDGFKGERDGLQVRLDSAASPAVVSAAVKARTALEAKARAVLGDEVDLSAKSDREVMVDVIRTDSRFAEDDLSEKTASAGYIEGLFKAIAAAPSEGRQVRQDSLDALQVAMSGLGRSGKPAAPRQGANGRAAIKARHAAMLARTKGGY